MHLSSARTPSNVGQAWDCWRGELLIAWMGRNLLGSSLGLLGEEAVAVDNRGSEVDELAVADP
jgi:hypothetical protein